MHPGSRDFAGRLDELELESGLLRGNPLDDPHRRPVWVYTPPGYDADAPRLPYDTTTGELVPEIWARWLEWDPVRLAKRHAGALRSMRAVYVDAGKSDEFYLDLGALAFKRELEAAGVKDFFFELFDATHKAIEYRYPLARTYLVERLGPG